MFKVDELGEAEEIVGRRLSRRVKRKAMGLTLGPLHRNSGVAGFVPKAESTRIADRMKPVANWLSQGHRKSYAIGAGVVGAGAMVSRNRSGRAIDQSNGTPRGMYGR